MKAVHLQRLLWRSCAAAAVLAAGCAAPSGRPAAQSGALPAPQVQAGGDLQGPASENPEPLESAPAQPAAAEPSAPQAQAPADAAAGPPAPSPELSSAADAGNDDKAPCKQIVEPGEPMLDETRRLLEETTCSAALWADSLFGEKGDVEAARKVHGHVELSGGYSQFDGSKIRLRMDVRAELPTLKHRVNAFIGRDNENDFLRDRSEGFALRSQFPRLDDREGWLGGLGYSFPETDRLRSEFRVGVHGLNPPQVFVQWRTRYNVYSDENNIVYLRGTPFWNSDDGVGLTLNFDVSHILSPTRLLRLSTAATRSQHTQGVDWRSAVILYQNLRAGRAVALESFVRGSTEAAEPLSEYGARTIYRQPLVDQKLFVELILGYSWPRNDPALPRHGSAGAGLSIDLPFGKTALPAAEPAPQSDAGHGSAPPPVEKN